MNVIAEPLVAPRTLRARKLARGRTWILAGADLIAVLAALAAPVGAAALLGRDAVDAPTSLLVLLALVAGPYWLCVFTAYRLYDRESRRVTTTSFDDVRDVFHALATGSLLVLLATQIAQAVTGWRLGTPLDVALFVATALVAVPLARGIVRSWVFPRAVRPRRVCVIGSGTEVELVKRKLQTHPEYGFDIVGTIEDVSGASDSLSRAEELAARVDALDVDRVLLASPLGSHEEMLDFIRLMRRPDVQLSIVPRFFEVFTSNASLDELEGMPLVSLPPMRLGRSSRLLKRTVDVTASAIILMFLAPVLAAVAVAIRLDSRGPIIFRQPRRGRDGSTFPIAKFRTMHVDAESQRDAVLHLNEVDGPLFKVKTGRDPRVTRVGAFLRKTSLDELPQLWNVLRGDMSLVGPRPFVVYEADRITGWGRRRLDMTPGVTGLWQVLGRNDIPFDEMLKLDYLYVTNWSVWWDLKILCQTIPVVLARRGAY